MIRVFGEMPIGVDVDWPTKSVTFHRTDMAQSPEICRFDYAGAADELVRRMESAEYWLEYAFKVAWMPGQVAIGTPPMTVQVEDLGCITWVLDMVSRPVICRVTAHQSEGLRRATNRAIAVLRTGTGDMVTP